MRIAVVALGKIGLPLAVQFARKGHAVVGVDLEPRIVDLVTRGEEPFPGEAHLQEYLGDAVRSGRLRATTEFAAAIRDAEVVVVVVPLVVDPVTGHPDFTGLDRATASIGEHLTAGTLVSYETTLPVGTTRGRWLPMLERGSSLREGTDFHLVFSPERVLTGRVFADLRKYPKLIGALSPAGAAAARTFYDSVLDFDDRADLARPNGVWDLGSPEAAELAKLAETTYRDVNIGLANQFAQFAAGRGIDVHAVIEASNSQPYSHIHRPGIAVGGHCIPVYPRLYLWNDPAATVVAAARAANERMPEYGAALLEELLGPLDGLTVVILGAAYRGAVKETAFSGVFPLVDALATRRADVLVHDPLYTEAELTGLGLRPYRPGDPVDAVVVQADHPQYRHVTPAQFPGVRALVDGRRIVDLDAWRNVAVRTI